MYQVQLGHVYEKVELTAVCSGLLLDANVITSVVAVMMLS